MTEPQEDTVSDVRPSATPPGDDPAAIEAHIEATRAHLSDTVDELAVRIHPKTIGERAAEDARARLHDAVYTPDGQPRIERIAAVGAAVVALVSLIVWRRIRAHRSS